MDSDRKWTKVPNKNSNVIRWDLNFLRDFKDISLVLFLRLADLLYRRQPVLLEYVNGLFHS